MKIKFVKISELIPADYNPRQASQKEVDDIKQSLEKFGFVDPILINSHPSRENVIIGGHLRCKVWAEMGNETVPTVIVNLPPEDERELNIRLNKNTGSWDYELLLSEFNTEELTAWGFDDKELNFDVPELKDNSQELSTVRDQVEVQFQLGEIRFRVKEEQYLEWIDAVVADSGFSDEEKLKCVKSRLKLN